MTTVIQRRSAAARKAYARRPKRPHMTVADIGGPDAAHRGTAKGDYTVRELLDRIRARSGSPQVVSAPPGNTLSATPE